MIQTIFNQEKSERLARPLPFYLYEIHRCPNVGGNKIVIPPHWHGEFEVVLSGCHALFRLDDRELEIFPGDVVVVPCEALHACQCEDVGEMYAVTIDPTFFDFKLLDFVQTRSMIPLQTGRLAFRNRIQPLDAHYPEVRQTLQTLICDSRESPPPVVTKAHAFELLALLVGFFSWEWEEERAGDGTLESLKRSLKFLCENFLRPLSLDEIAGQANLSKYFYLRRFQEAFHRTPIQYLIELRLQYAYDLILRGETVTAACFDSGFNNLSYFIRRFKETYGTTPSRLKKASANETQ